MITGTAADSSRGGKGVSTIEGLREVDLGDIRLAFDVSDVPSHEDSVVSVDGEARRGGIGPKTAADVAGWRFPPRPRDIARIVDVLRSSGQAIDPGDVHDVTWSCRNVGSVRGKWSHGDLGWK